MKLPLSAVLAIAVASAAIADPPPPTPKGTAPATRPAEPAPASESDPAPAESATIQFTGVFVPADPIEIELDFAAYAGPVEVKKVLPHGAQVAEGDMLLALEAPDLVTRHEEAGRAVELAEARLAAARVSADLDVDVAAFELATAERKVDEAEQALRWFEESDALGLAHNAQQAVQANRDAIADSEDELEQLRRMYSSEELTNDTADIVVKRAVRQLERLKARQEVIEARSAKTLEYDLQTQRASIEDRIARAGQNLERVRIAQRLAEVERSANLESAELAYEATIEAAAELERIRAVVDNGIEAPADGILLYGHMQGEQWGGGDPDRFEAGTEFVPQGVLMTVVVPDQLAVQALLPEAHRNDIAVGMAVKVTTPAVEDAFPGTITEIAALPTQRGNARFFPVTIEVDADNIAPASTATVTIAAEPAARRAPAIEQEGFAFDAALHAEFAATADVAPGSSESNSRGPTARGSDADDDPYLKPVRRRDSIDAAITDAVAFLIADQNDDGSWGTGTETRGTEIYSMVPGSHDAFRVATTALAAMALDESGHRDTDAYRNAIAHLVTKGQARRDDSRILYNTWAQTYALQALSREIRRNPDDADLRQAAQWQLDKLVAYEVYVGGWNYYDFGAGTQTPSMEATSFGTAAALGALHEARSAGLDIPDGLIDRAVRRLAEMRTPLGTYVYSGSLKLMPQMGANRERGSVGRTQSAVWALGLFGHEFGDADDADHALKMLRAEHDWLNMGRKRPYPHEAWYQTSGYYYYFAMHHAGLLVETLDDAEAADHAAAVVEMILPYQEEDGSFWDYAMWDYHKPYGTAYAVMALTRLAAESAETAQP